MSVLIRGMKIPKSCANCEWSKLSKMDLGMSCFCTLAKKIGSLEIAKNNRLDFCPLIPVTPHGRLIDADGMIGKLIENGKRVFGSGDIPECSSLSIVRDYVESAPTVIDAEEGE